MNAALREFAHQLRDIALLLVLRLRCARCKRRIKLYEPTVLMHYDGGEIETMCADCGAYISRMNGGC